MYPGVQCTNAGRHGVQCTREYSVLMQVNMGCSEPGVCMGCSVPGVCMGCSVPGVWEEQQVASDRIMTLDYCGVVSPSA